MTHTHTGRLAAERSPTRVNPHDTTKRLIVETALAHFSRHGIDGVSLSQLREASGQNNRSAIHYHFGNKAGLLRAVTDHVKARLTPFVRQSLMHCDQMQRNGKLTPQELVRLLGYPFSTLFYLDDEGRDCVRYLSHLSHETDPNKLAFLIECLRELIQGMMDLLTVVMPGKSPQDYTALVFLSITQLIETLSALSWLHHEAMDSLRKASPPNDSDVLAMSVKFACGGLVAAGS